MGRAMTGNEKRRSFSPLQSFSFSYILQEMISEVNLSFRLDRTASSQTAAGQQRSCRIGLQELNTLPLEAGLLCPTEIDLEPNDSGVNGRKMTTSFLSLPPPQKSLSPSHTLYYRSHHEYSLSCSPITLSIGGPSRVKVNND
ncbi:hypothetical protein E2320_007527 [Naja naja]|nr:hypothetical protein E2320_007527 [Naja naja]